MDDGCWFCFGEYRRVYEVVGGNAMTITLTREEAQQVLDALEGVKDMAWDSDTVAGRKLIETFRARLAQPERSASEEPVTWMPIETAPTDNERPLYLARFNEDGELVELDFNGAWEYWDESWEMSHINGYCWVSERGIEEPTHWAYQDEPIPYEAPPQRKWQGLTDEEIKAMWNEWKDALCLDHKTWAQAIEAKLKEKNYDKS
jgi:hypothetical protein